MRERDTRTPVARRAGPAVEGRLELLRDIRTAGDKGPVAKRRPHRAEPAPRVVRCRSRSSRAAHRNRRPWCSQRLPDPTRPQFRRAALPAHPHTAWPRAPERKPPAACVATRVTDHRTNGVPPDVLGERTRVIDVLEPLADGVVAEAFGRPSERRGQRWTNFVRAVRAWSRVDIVSSCGRPPSGSSGRTDSIAGDAAGWPLRCRVRALARGIGTAGR